MFGGIRGSEDIRSERRTLCMVGSVLSVIPITLKRGIYSETAWLLRWHSVVSRWPAFQTLFGFSKVCRTYSTRACRLGGSSAGIPFAI